MNRLTYRLTCRVTFAVLLALGLAACAKPSPQPAQDRPEFLADTEPRDAVFLPRSATSVQVAQATQGAMGARSRGARSGGARSGGDAVWHVHAGQNLSEILTAWGQIADRTVVWQTSHDWPLAVNGRFEGSFDDALAWIVAGVSDTSPRPHVQQFENASVRVLAEE